MSHNISQKEPAIVKETFFLNTFSLTLVFLYLSSNNSLDSPIILQKFGWQLSKILRHSLHQETIHFPLMFPRILCRRRYHNAFIQLLIKILINFIKPNNIFVCNAAMAIVLSDKPATIVARKIIAGLSQMLIKKRKTDFFITNFTHFMV